jgi:hypothetical protein
LLEAVHSFFNLDAYVAVVTNDGVELVLFAESGGEIFVFNPHALWFFHRHGEEMILEISR